MPAASEVALEPVELDVDVDVQDVQLADAGGGGPAAATRYDVGRSATCPGR